MKAKEIRPPFEAVTHTEHKVFLLKTHKNNKDNFNRNQKIRTDLIRVAEHAIGLAYSGANSNLIISILSNEIHKLRTKYNARGYLA